MVLLNLLVSLKLRSSKVNDAISDLGESAEFINAAFTRYYEEGDTGESLYNYIGELAQKKNCLIWITDSYDRIVYVMSGIDEKEEYEGYALINMQMLAASVKNGGSAYTIAEGNGMFYSPLVTVGCPIQVQGQAVGSVYLHLRLTDLATTIKIFSAETAFTLTIGIMLCLVLSFIVSRWISRPLYDMNEASLALARGNFKQRIKVRDNSEIGRLSETFNMMAEELEKYEDTRESFIGNVSHELKSPITAIQGFVQGMLDGTIDESERRQYLEIVLAESHRMNALIGDLLDLVKIQSGQFPIKTSVWDVKADSQMPYQFLK
jgi:signal transduction histidine kinase